MIEIPVSLGKYVALIDDIDFELVAAYKWRVYKGGAPGASETLYAIAHVLGDKSHSVIMHRLILKAPKGVMVDHKDSDGLHNWRLNLRLSNNQQNQRNRKSSFGSFSIYKGVTLDKRHGIWRASITVDAKQQWLGHFESEETAARAYDEAARRLFGEFARCNFNQ